MVKQCNLWALSFILGLAACGSGAETESVPLVRPAKIYTVERADKARDLTFPAVVRAARSAELTFQVAGTIEELNVLEGQDVEEGFVIAKLDQRNARNNVAQARAEYRNATTEYERAERLYTQDAIAKSALDSRKTQADIAEVALANAERTLADTVLRAPFSGGISRVYPEQFQNIQGKEPIVVIQSDEVEAVFNAPGTIVARVPQLQRVSTMVTLDAAPGVEIPAIFKEAAGVADPATQTYEISFGFVPPDDLLILPGMTATISSVFLFDGASDIAPDGVAAPLSAILSEGVDLYVFVINPSDMSISKRAVVVEAGDGPSVIVTSGLQDGDQIVSAGVSFLHDGMTIRPWTPE